MNAIREAREAAGISQGELAKRIGVTPGAVSQWEQGTTNPSIHRLKAIAQTLGVTVDELLEE